MLSDVRKRFIEMTGRYDLIVSGDLSTNVDSGANKFINTGMRWLDSKVSRRNGNHRFTKILNIGEGFLRVPRLIAVKSLRIIDATGHRDLTRHELLLDDFHLNLISPRASGAPKHWTQSFATQADDSELALTENQEDIIHITQEFLRNTPMLEANPGLLTEPRFWNIDTDDGMAYAASTGIITLSSSGTPNLVQVAADMGRRIRSGDIFQVDYEVITRGQGSTRAVLGTVLGTERAAGTGVFSEVLTAAEDDPQFSIAFTNLPVITLKEPSIKLLSSFEATEPEAILDQLEENLHRIATILFTVNTDRPYTIEVIGRFYHKPLSADTDENWWTVNYENLLAQAGARVVEEELQSGARLGYWDVAMARDIDEIEADATELEYTAAGVTYERTR